MAEESQPMPWRLRLIIAVVGAASWAVVHLVLYTARVSEASEPFSWAAYGEELGLVYLAILVTGIVGSVLGLAVMGPIMLIHKRSLRSKE